MNLNNRKIGLYFILLTLLVGFTGCKNDPEVDPIDQDRQELLSFMRGEWQSTEVRKDNTIITDFSNLVIEFDELRLSSSGGEPIWPSSVSFTISDENSANKFVLPDGIEFTVVRQNENLQISLNYQQSNLRSGIEGDYSFILTKN